MSELITIEISSSILYKKLSVIYSVIETKPILQILDTFLFNFSTNVVKVTASNGHVTLFTDINVVNDVHFNIAIPAKILIDTLKNFSDQPIKLYFDCKLSMLKIKSNNGEYNIACENAECFPIFKMESNEKIEIDSNILKNAIKNTIIVASNDTSKININSILLSVDNSNIIAVATDMHRLIQFKQKVVNVSNNFSLLIAKKDIFLLYNLLSNDKKVILSFDSQYVKVQLDDVVWSSTLITKEKFLDYETIIPKNNVNTMIVNRNDLLWSLKRLSGFTDELTLCIKFNISGNKLKITASNINFNNKAEEILDVTYSGEDNLNVAYNIKYLLEIFKNLDSDNVSFLFSNKVTNNVSSKTSIIKPIGNIDYDVLALVMPMNWHN